MASEKQLSTSVDKLNNLLTKAKINLLDKKNAKFISNILYRLKFHWDETTATAKTNGIVLKINPQFFLNLTAGQRVFLLAHETWHVAFNHMGRCKYRNRMKYNIAADYVINEMLINDKYEGIEGMLYDSTYFGLSTDAIYDLLDDLPELPMEDIEPIDSKEQEEQIKSTLIKANLASKQYGTKETIPQEISKFIEQLVNPKLAWNVILQNYLNAYSKDDYSYRKPNKKYFPDLYIPSQYSESINEIAVAIDTSGSVSNKDIQIFLKEIKYIKTSMNIEKINLVNFDTRIQGEFIITDETDLDNIVLYGRGGTSLFPVIKHFDTKDITFLIVFSDLYCTPIDKSPNYEIIWVCVDNPNAKVNCGKLIHFSTEVHK